MSAEDIYLDGTGAPRMQHSIAKRDDSAEHADAILKLWHQWIRPEIHVLDPQGFSETDFSCQVEIRDDDEPLARLVYLVGADALFASDCHFEDALAVLGRSPRGSVLSW